MSTHTTPQTLSPQELWKRVLSSLEVSESEATFNTWFKETHLIKKEGGDITIGVPNQFVLTWIRDKYHKTILRILREHDESVRSVEYTVSTPKTRERSLQETTPILTNKDELPLQDHYIDKRDNLNPRYTFETFVVGPFNGTLAAAIRFLVDRGANDITAVCLLAAPEGCDSVIVLVPVGHLAKSKQVTECVSRQWLRYALRHKETSGDAASIAAAQEAFDKAWAEITAIPDGYDTELARTIIAKRIVKAITENHEHDPERLKAYALEGFDPHQPA